jgi:hypothetical protein
MAASMLRLAALNGVDLGILFEDQVAAHNAKRRLIRVLENQCPLLPGSIDPARKE